MIGGHTINTIAIIAWWGAILSTTVFVWDIYKYRRAGLKLRFNVWTDRIMMPSLDRRTFVQSEVTNYGDRPTTLTNICVYYFEKSWSLRRLRNRPTKAAVLVDLNTPQVFPWELKAGSVWHGLTEQTPELEEWGRTGVLYFDLYYSHETKPIRRRVRFYRKTSI